jgi:hypothetical protein
MNKYAVETDPNETEMVFNRARVAARNPVGETSWSTSGRVQHNKLVLSNHRNVYNDAACGEIVRQLKARLQELQTELGDQP